MPTSPLPPPRMTCYDRLIKLPDHFPLLISLDTVFIPKASGDRRQLSQLSGDMLSGPT